MLRFQDCKIIVSFVARQAEHCGKRNFHWQRKFSVCYTYTVFIWTRVKYKLLISCGYNFFLLDNNGMSPLDFQSFLNFERAL